MPTSQRNPSVEAQEDHLLALDIEPTTNTTEKAAKRPRTVVTRDAARKMVKPMRSMAIFGAVGVLVAGIALPSFAASSTPSADAPATLQQVAFDDAQSLVVASEATASPLDRGTYAATTPEEIEKKKAEEAAAARAAAAAAAASVASPGVSINTGNYELVSPGSGEVRYPLPQGSYNVSRTVGGAHQGADMLAPQGTPIYATAAGTVRASAESIGGYGVAVMIDHVIGGQVASSVYGHMVYGSRQVQVGQYVAAGQLIGFVGSTGRSTANHLHFEVRVNGGLMEPIAWLRANAG
ncbi:M23 family metallopeptidase [Microbacterium sp. A82]|uniref:M23 family metallopeptidase n=1 Tax=unclassified Microbacterium TaxID=2609290 RepID=UPI003F393F60